MSRAEPGRGWVVVAVTVALLVSSVTVGVAIAGETDGRPTDAVAANAAAQALPELSGTVPLNESGVTLVGGAAGDLAGWTVARAGDVNGDGVVDLIVGAPRNDSDAGTNAGAAYLFFGPVEDGPIDLSDADVTFTGVGPQDHAGWSVAAAGDLDEDGFDDVVVGAPFNDSAGRNAGAAYVVFGGPALQGPTSLSTADVVLLGGDAGDRAGWAVGSLLAGEDRRAVLVGAPHDDEGGQNAGAAYVVSVGIGTDVVDLDEDADAKLVGERVGDNAGWAVAAAGDVNNDSVADVIVGAPRSNHHTIDDGAAYLVSGDVDGRLDLVNASVTLIGEARSDRAGWSVAAAGDVNNDSIADVMVGAPLNDSAGRNAGATYLVFGDESLDGAVNLSEADVRLTGAAAGDLAGWSVAGSGDVTCDGVDDVIVGAPRNDTRGEDSGVAYIVAGNESLPDARPLNESHATLAGVAAGDHAGFDVAGVEDANDDGDADVLVGAPFDDSAGQDAGAAYVAFGQCPPEPTGEDEEEEDEEEEEDDEEKDEKEKDEKEEDEEDDEKEEEEEKDEKDEEGSLEAGDVRARCDDAGGVIRITNPNDEPVRVRVDGPGVSERLTVDPGETIRIGGDLANGEYEIQTRSAADGSRIDTETVEIDCQEPRGVNVETTCRTNGGVLTVENPNDVRVTVRIFGPGAFSERVRLDPDEDASLDELANGDYEVVTLTRLGDLVARETVEIDCAEPPEEARAATAWSECVSDGARLTVGNPGEVAIEVSITGPDGFDETVTLDPGEEDEFHPLPDGEYEVVTRTTDGEVLDRETLEIDCPEPVDVSTACAEGGGVLTIENPNDVTVMVSIGGPSLDEEEFTLDPGESATFENLADGEYDVFTLSVPDQHRIGKETVEVECDVSEDDG